MESFCRNGVKWAYKHHVRKYSHNEDYNEDIKNNTAKLDVLRNNV